MRRLKENENRFVQINCLFRFHFHILPCIIFLSHRINQRIIKYKINICETSFHNLDQIKFVDLKTVLWDKFSYSLLLENYISFKRYKWRERLCIIPHLLPPPFRGSNLGEGVRRIERIESRPRYRNFGWRREKSKGKIVGAGREGVTFDERRVARAYIRRDRNKLGGWSVEKVSGRR